MDDFRFIDVVGMSLTSWSMKIFSSRNLEEFISNLLGGDKLIILETSLDYPSTFKYGPTVFGSQADRLPTHVICHQANLVKNCNSNALIS